MARADLGDLGQIIERLEQRGRLIRVKSEVDPVHDLAGVAARLEGRPAAVLFERVKGHDAPVFTGLYWSRALLADLLEQPEKQLPAYVSGRIKEWQQKPMPPVVVEHGPVLEVTENRVDLSKLPIPTHALQDGGPYFDAAVVIAKDPETGVRNASIQRFMVVASDRMNINIDAGRHLETYLEKAATEGRVAAVHAERRGGAGGAFRRRDALGSGADRHRRARHRERVPGRAAGARPEHPVGRRDDRARDVCAGMRDDPGRGRRRGAVRRGHGLLRQAGAAPGGPRQGDPPPQAAGVPDHPLGRRGVELGRPARRGERAHAGPASGARRQGRVLQPRRLRLLSLRRGDAAGARGLVEAGDHGDLRRVPAAQDGHRGRRRRRHPQPDGRGMGDDHPARSADRRDHRPECFGHGLNPSFPNYQGTKIGFDCTRPCPYTSEYDRAAYKEVSLDDYELAGGGATS